jgi:ABC-type oligopeptide transport system substrate-binding subunit
MTEVLQDRYELVNVIGHGGMGTVVRGHDLLLDRDIAVKVLTNPKLKEEAQKRLLREAQAAAKLNHPNIVSIHDAGFHKDIPFIVMELVEGEPLHRTHLEGLDEMIQIAVQICDALEHAHGEKIVHRDLKPDNVIITPDGHAKLTDFGLARSISSRLTTDGIIEGTVQYMAPEQALGKDIDHRTDLYSLGVMLYEMATGKLPFQADEPLQIITQHLHIQAVPPSALKPDLPASLDKLIVKLLKKDLADRPATASSVRIALEETTRPKFERETAEEFAPLDQMTHGRMVGREQEFNEATRIWMKASSGESQVFLVSGEPGIGKTRFVRELMTLARIQGGIVLQSECYAEGGAPHAPIASIIRQSYKLEGDHLMSLPDLYIANLLSITTDLQLLAENLSIELKPDLDLDLEKMSESFVALCSSISKEAPLLIIIEDAHWADSGTLHLIRHLARRSKSSGFRLLLVMTYREIELDESKSLNETIFDLTKERIASRIKLLRLNRMETQEMLSAILKADVADDFTEGIYRETEGNPFFAEEICRALIEEGKLYREGDRWCCFDAASLHLPQSVRTAVQERIGRLPSEAQDILLNAAILGREFEYDVLKHFCECDEDTLIDSLEIAEKSKLIMEVKQAINGRTSKVSSFAFTHALFATTLKESISAVRRKRLHLQAATALEQVFPNRLEELAPRIGHHLVEAGEESRAVDYLILAGDSARRVYAYKEAIEAYEQALDFMKTIGEYDRAARTYMKLGLIYHTTFNFQLSRQAYQEGFAQWQMSGSNLGEADPTDLEVLHTHWPAIYTLDPCYSSDTYSTGIIDQLFRGLVDLNPDMTIVPDAARSWDLLDDGRKYVFHLNDDMFWSDGNPVTAFDFEFAWKRVLDPATGSETASHLFDVKNAKGYQRGEIPSDESIGVHALDDHTLIVDLEGPTGSFLYHLSLPTAYAVPRHVVSQYGSEWVKTKNIVVNGAFAIEEWLNGEIMVLTRNPRYNGRFSGNVHRVELTEQTDQSNVLEKYENNELDVLDLGAIEPVAAQRAIHLNANEYLSIPGPTTSFLGFNTNRSPFNDKRVRLAFAHAIDREILADVVLRDRGSPATGGFVPPGIPGYSSEIGLLYKPKRAQELLAEAGYPNGTGFPEVELVFPASPGITQRAELLKSQLEENLLVQVTWEAIDLSGYLDGLGDENPHVYSIAWKASYPDPEDFLSLVFSKFFSLHEDEMLESLVTRAKHTASEDERMRLYREADKQLIEDAVIVPLSYGNHNLLLKPWLKKFPLSPLKLCFWKHAVVSDRN